MITDGNFQYHEKLIHDYAETGIGVNNKGFRNWNLLAIKIAREIKE